MNFKIDKHNIQIFCHICGEWKIHGIETYELPDMNGNHDYDQIRCLDDDEDKNYGALLGYRKDLPRELISPAIEQVKMMSEGL